MTATPHKGDPENFCLFLSLLNRDVYGDVKRFLGEEDVGKQAPFSKLAQSLSALYPAGLDEKRWVDGVLARKKGLGFG